jgi:SAM-dependent methyltransferase
MSNPKSLLNSGNYASDWVKHFYTQAGIWWGAEPHDSAEEHIRRLGIVRRLFDKQNLRILDLGCGSGGTAAAFADAGYDVVGVELNPTDMMYAKKLLDRSRPGKLTFIEADFYTVLLDGQFDVVTWWEGFGLGSDADQRKMLGRIANEWLKPGGCALVDVYFPARPARHEGEVIQLNALPDVPGSVEMLEKSYYDVINARWIDEWQPVKNPENALAQSLRCYSPADLLLLLEGTGLKVQEIQIEDETIVLDLPGDKIQIEPALLEAWAYMVQLVRENC